MNEFYATGHRHLRGVSRTIDATGTSALCWGHMRPNRIPLLLAVVLWLASFEVSLRAQPTATEALRRYDQGPLGRADFATPPPADRGVRKASTYVHIGYSFRYRANVVRGRVQVVVTHLEAYGVVTPGKSWNVAPGDTRLMDHEQGHFDITQLHALRWQRHAGGLIAKAALRGEGATQEAAQQSLQSRLDRELKPINEAWEAEQIRYDQETNHGSDSKRQAEWRARLNRELAAGTVSRR